MRLTALIGGIVTAVLVGHFTFQNQENVKLAVGAFDDPFVSIQLATDPDNGECLTTDGSNNVWSTSCGRSISSLNGLSTSSQSFATATSGNLSLNISSNGNIHTFTPVIAPGFLLASTSDFSNWNTAFSWGNHATRGYATNTPWITIPGGLRTSTTTDFAQADSFIATSTTATSTFAGKVRFGNTNQSLANVPVTIQGTMSQSLSMNDVLVLERPFNSGVFRGRRASLSVGANNSTSAGPTRLDFMLGSTGVASATDTALPDTNVMTLLGTSKVGIGTVSPISVLQIYQNDTEVGTGGGMTIEQAGTGDAQLQFLLTGTRRWTMGIDNSDGDKFKISPTTDVGTGVMTIDTSGNVGIGTSTPNQKLTVTGDAYISSGLTLLGALKDSTNATGTSGMVLKTNGTSTQWVATSTLGLGNNTFLALTDTTS